MDVGGWLRKLGLEQYEASFRENKIDDTVLPRLTADLRLHSRRAAPERHSSFARSRGFTTTFQF
jgi:hypothetical protein